MKAKVAYECDTPAHRASDGGGPDKLTVHEGEWAFCPFDARAAGHEWRPTGGLTLSMLQHAAHVRRTERVKERSSGK